MTDADGWLGSCALGCSGSYSPGSRYRRSLRHPRIEVDGAICCRDFCSLAFHDVIVAVVVPAHCC